jgi:hypothetical protein
VRWRLAGHERRRAPFGRRRRASAGSMRRCRGRRQGVGEGWVGRWQGQWEQRRPGLDLSECGGAG